MRGKHSAAQTLYRSMHDISLECCVVTFGRSCEPLCFYLPKSLTFLCFTLTFSVYVTVHPNNGLVSFFFLIKCTSIFVMVRAIVKMN